MAKPELSKMSFKDRVLNGFGLFFVLFIAGVMFALMIHEIRTSDAHATKDTSQLVDMNFKDSQAVDTSLLGDGARPYTVEFGTCRPELSIRSSGPFKGEWTYNPNPEPTGLLRSPRSEEGLLKVTSFESLAAEASHYPRLNACLK